MSGYPPQPAYGAYEQPPAGYGYQPQQPYYPPPPQPGFQPGQPTVCQPAGGGYYPAPIQNRPFPPNDLVCFFSVSVHNVNAVPLNAKVPKDSENHQQ
ncbi:hypothetical protein HNY73_007871 [Argiope bruennichi]|uniref:Uncharacterized protein n=1 Tax=Argiope bruennichi TaxID=94029 RepID=A0A8T0F706_ARGBR|nr:hypothetical protein HNY73_007871 [Argiope bruennichi]